MKESRIRLVGEEGRIKIEIAGVPHPVIFERPIQLGPGYTVSVYKFEDEKGKEAGGCKFAIEPHQSTNSVFVANDTAFEDVVLSGSGWFHAIDPNGEVVTYPFNGGNTSKAVEYGNGWIITWVAGKTELNVLSLNHPPFTEAAEIKVEVGSKEIGGKIIPPWYWDVYRRLKASR